MTDETPPVPPEEEQPEIHGTGALQDPPDPRDIIVTEGTLEELAGAPPIPASFRLKNRPPVTNQGNTPQCVAYSSAMDQNYMDRGDFGKFLNFNEGLFFSQIGGGPNGAYMSAALSRRLNHGYPEQDSTPVPQKHQVASYFKVEKTKAAVQRAIMQLGGVLTIGPWWQSWSRPQGSRAILPPPSGASSGHAWWAVGWTEDGYVVGQNSWGTGWGANGLFLIRWSDFLGAMWDVWKTADEETTPPLVKAAIRAIDVNIRTSKVLGPDGILDPTTNWGETRKAGIWRRRDKKIVATPWNKALRFKGWKPGARHGQEPYPSSWGVVVIDGADKAVARPLLRLVTA